MTTNRVIMVLCYLGGGVFDRKNNHPKWRTWATTLSADIFMRWLSTIVSRREWRSQQIKSPRGRVTQQNVTFLDSCDNWAWIMIFEISDIKDTMNIKDYCPKSTFNSVGNLRSTTTRTSDPVEQYSQFPKKWQLKHSFKCTTVHCFSLWVFPTVVSHN